MAPASSPRRRRSCTTTNRFSDISNPDRELFSSAPLRAPLVLFDDSVEILSIKSELLVQVYRWNPAQVHFSFERVFGQAQVGSSLLQRQKSWSHDAGVSEPIC